MLLTSCQFLPAEQVTRYGQQYLQDVSQPGIIPINFLMSGRLYPRRHLLAEVLNKKLAVWEPCRWCLAYAEVFWWPDSEDALRTFATADLNMLRESFRIIGTDSHWFPFTTFYSNWRQKIQSTIPEESLYASFILTINLQPAVSRYRQCCELCQVPGEWD